MKKTIIFAAIASIFMLMSSVQADNVVNGQPVILKHLGTLPMPAELESDLNATGIPFLTQDISNQIHDLHGEVGCDLIFTTPGNYHMALRDAMYGAPALGHPVGLIELIKNATGQTVCWTTSPPIGADHVPSNAVVFTNIKVVGKPALMAGPGAYMNAAASLYDVSSRKAFLRNRGNAMLVPERMINKVKSVCDLANPSVRVITPRPNDGSGASESGSFGNFSGTIYNVIKNNPDLKCHGQEDAIFDAIFDQDPSGFELSKLDDPYNAVAIMDFFLQQDGLRWVASSRIMHRDQPYALCHNMADVGIIFYHQAKYLKDALPGCKLHVVPFHPKNAASPESTLSGNQIGTIQVAKVLGTFTPNQEVARDMLYDFITAGPGSVWDGILNFHGMFAP